MNVKLRNTKLYSVKITLHISAKNYNQPSSGQIAGMQKGGTVYNCLSG
jgi:hypothetical protein